jgi:hypothetical protein
LIRVQGAPIGAPSSDLIADRARANVAVLRPRGGARAAAASGHGDRVRARNDRVRCRDLPRISSQTKGDSMTAYLISLALAGLVAILAGETLS